MSLHTEELDEILANSEELRAQLIEWAARIAVEARLDELAQLTDTVVERHYGMVGLAAYVMARGIDLWASGTAAEVADA